MVTDTTNIITKNLRDKSVNLSLTDKFDKKLQDTDELVQIK